MTAQNRFPGRRLGGQFLFAIGAALMLAPFSFWLAGVVALLSFTPSLLSSARAMRARLGLVRPDFTADPAAYPARLREFETLPFENPFDPASAHLPLERRISMAAEASAQYSRSVSVLFLAVDDDVEAQRACAALRDTLRPSDHVERVEGGIVACLNLIRDLSNVEGVVARLTRRLADAGWPQETPPRFGRALYPMHGYCGADLIAAAQAQARPASLPLDKPAARGDRPAATPAKTRRRKAERAGGPQASRLVAPSR